MPSPELIFETINSYQRSAAVKAAIELDLFTAIGEGARTPAALAPRCQAAERGMRVLCDYLAIIGLLSKSDGQYALTEDTAIFLDRRSPASIATATRFLLSEDLTAGFKDLTATVRKGGTTISEEGTVSRENPVWVEFARAMAPMMAPAAEGIATLLGVDSGAPCKVLDIAAGHGLFGIAIARRNPNAEIVALDWPSVLEVARENARAAGVDARLRTIPGSAFEADYGSGYDIVLLTNFLHHFDAATCESLLRKVRAALKPGGRAVTLEFVPNEDRVSPPVPASFSLMMLGTTARGDAYTFRELERMFRNAGFRESRLEALPMSPESVVVSA